MKMGGLFIFWLLFISAYSVLQHGEEGSINQSIS